MLRLRYLSSLSNQPPSKVSGVADKVFNVREPIITLERDDKRDDTRLPRPLSYYLDTHNAVVQLQGAGYSTEQAEALVKVLTESLHNSVAPIEASVLSRSDLELVEVHMLRELETVCNKVIRLENTTLEALKKENEELKDTVGKLKSGFREEVTKVQSNLQLDLNLEKGRIKEEATVVLQQVKDTNNRIDTEVAQVRMQIEAQKLESVKYLAGVSLSVMTIVLSVVLGVWRLMK